MQTIEELFEHELKSVHRAEHLMLDVLEQMADESSDRDIRRLFTQHRKETQAQIKRVTRALKLVGVKSRHAKCPAVDGLVKEKKAFLREKPSAELREYYNLGAVQKVERYEIATYEGLVDMADKLGLTPVVRLLEQNLREEQAALERVRSIAAEFDVADEHDFAERDN